MSAGSVTFTDAIRSYAGNNGIDLSAEHVGILDSVLKSLGRIEGDQIAFSLDEGRSGTFEDIMARETESAPRVPAQKVEPIPVAAGATATARALAKNAALRLPTRVAEAKRLADEHGNPWSPRSINRSRQAAITNLDSTLADQLRSMAGL